MTQLKLQIYEKNWKSVKRRSLITKQLEKVTPSEIRKAIYATLENPNDREQDTLIDFI